MTPRQAAKLIGCDPSHLCRLIRQGKVRATSKPDPDKKKGVRYEISKGEALRVKAEYKDNQRGRPRGKLVKKGK